VGKQETLELLDPRELLELVWTEQLDLKVTLVLRDLLEP